jgi:hypothetical protein
MQVKGQFEGNGDLVSFESGLMTFVRDYMAKRESDLRESGLHMNGPSLRRWNTDDPSHYGSEIELDFVRTLDGELSDSLDLLIVSDGQPRFTIEEAADWYRLEVSRLLKPPMTG